jgi:ubiquinone/menaquinone biosynthesis C-methylase UbiE
VTARIRYSEERAVIDRTYSVSRLPYTLGVKEEPIAGQWSQSAPYWEKHRTIIRTMFAPVTEALVADARIVCGQRVLDVGTGPGEPALTIAGLVGREGKVAGIDPSPEMVEAARRAAARDGIINVDFEVAPADSLPFAANTFDAVVSRFAAMFFPSPLEAIREILRVLKGEGRVSLAVWHFADRNPFHSVFARVVDRYVESAPAPPDSPDAFRFAGPGKLLALVKQAGAVNASERLLQFKIEAPLSVEDFWEMRSEMSDKMRSNLARLSADQRQSVRSEVIAAMREYATNDGVSFPAEVLVVSGQRA